MSPLPHTIFLLTSTLSGHFPIELNKANLEFWRGLAFQELSYCEKLPDKRMEMAMKSMDQWLPLLNRWPMKTDLAALGLPENCSAMIIFLSASDRNVYNYENIIEIKCSALKNIDKSNVKLAIQEVSIFKIILPSFTDAILSSIK